MRHVQCLAWSPGCSPRASLRCSHTLGPHRPGEGMGVSSSYSRQCFPITILPFRIPSCCQTWATLTLHAGTVSFARAQERSSTIPLLSCEQSCRQPRVLAMQVNLRFQLEDAKPAERGNAHTLVLHIEATVCGYMLGLGWLVNVRQPCRCTFSMTDKLWAVLEGTAAGVCCSSTFLHAKCQR